VTFNIKTMFRHVLSIKTRFCIVALGVFAVSFLSGNLGAPSYLRHLQTHPMEGRLLKGPFPYGFYPYTPPSGEFLAKARKSWSSDFKRIVLNNIASVTICCALATVVFFFPYVHTTVNGLLLGITFYVDGPSMFLKRCLPQGVIEEPLFLIIAAAGYQVGWTIFKASWKDKKGIIVQQFKFLSIIWVQCSLLLIVAAFLETYVRLYIFL